MKIGVVLLAGGIGSRMGGDFPKQFLEIKGKRLLEFSLDVFLSHPDCHELVIVCASEYRHLLQRESIKFAQPGKLRQESVYNGMKALSSDCSHICIHDGARPCINHKFLDRLFSAARTASAVVPGLPLRFTVKQVDADSQVKKTLDREHIWEVQTPQLVKRTILEKGFSLIQKKQIEVTDDVSIAELLGEPVQGVEGVLENIKVTVPQDLDLIKRFLA